MISNKFWICAPRYRKTIIDLYVVVPRFYLPVSSRLDQPWALQFFNSFFIIVITALAYVCNRKVVVSDPARLLAAFNRFNRVAGSRIFQKTIFGFWWNGLYELKLFSNKIENLQITHCFNKYIKTIDDGYYDYNIVFYEFPPALAASAIVKRNTKFEYDVCFVGQVFDCDDVGDFLNEREINYLFKAIDENTLRSLTETLDCQATLTYTIQAIKKLKGLVKNSEQLFRIASYFFRLHVMVHILRRTGGERIAIVGIDEAFIRSHFDIKRNLDLFCLPKLPYSESIELMRRSASVLDLGSKCFPDPNYPRAAQLKSIGVEIRSFVFKHTNLTI